MLVEVVVTTDPAVASKDVDVAILVAGVSQRQGMERKDVMAKNVAIYKAQASCLSQHASKDVKVCTKGFCSLEVNLCFRNMLIS